MLLATWNVNSVRARLERALGWLRERRPDVVCLQETKCLEEQFPREAFEELGYAAAVFGQKTYNGVAILARRSIEGVWKGIGEPSGEARVIGAQIGDLLVVNCYVVNGEAVGSEKYRYKLEWMARLREKLAALVAPGERIAVCGDFNVTFDDRDVADPEAWRGKVLCSAPERAALGAITELGLADSLRHFHAESGIHTWWDFRTRGFERGDGLRLDHILLSPAALASCRGVDVDVDARRGEKPSDHAPVIAEL